MGITIFIAIKMNNTRPAVMYPAPALNMVAPINLLYGEPTNMAVFHIHFILHPFFQRHPEHDIIQFENISEF